MILALPTATVDLDRRVVDRADGTQERLTALEAELLRYLDAHQDRIVSREELLVEVWGYAKTTLSRACDNTVRRLRTKIEADPSQPESLLTLHGAGYRLLRAGGPIPAPQAVPSSSGNDRRVALGDRILDLGRLQIERPDGTREALTANEYALLSVLVDEGGASVDRDRLQRAVWGTAAGRAIEHTVTRLRRKLEPEPTVPRHLLTTAVGYRLAVAHEPAVTRHEPPALPTELDARFGRDDEIARILGHFEAGDLLVTLTGPGGVGKSRLALAVARSWSAGGAWWVECAAAPTLEAWCITIARALRIPLSTGAPADAIGAMLAGLGEGTLVVLDNLEQLAEHVPIVGQWLREAPGVRLLCTSRILLQLTGERRLVVDPLGIEAAVALFLDRAERPPLASELPDVRGLAEDLEGLPLAIELAAARTRVLSVAELRARTSDRLKLLGGGDRDRPDRYRSMRASLDASWELATPWARAALAQLTVFRSGFALDAAEAAVDLAPWPEAPWVVDVVQELVDASLLRIRDDGRRFAMLQVVEDYAAEHLDPRERAQVRIRHARWFGRWAAGFATVDGPLEVEVRSRLLRELDNLLAAASCAADVEEALAGAEAAPAAWEVMELVGPFRVGAELCERLRWLPGLSTAIRARLALAAGRARTPLGEWEQARTHLTDAVALAHEAGDRLLEGRAWVELGALFQSRNDVAAMEQPAHTARTIALECDDRLLEARSLVLLSQWRRMRHEPQDSLRAGDAAVSLAEQLGARRVEALARCHLALAHRETRDLDAAGRELTRAGTAAADSGDERLLAVVVFQLGALEMMRGRLEAANAALSDARAVFSRVGDVRNETYTLRVLAENAHRRGRLAEARTGFEEVLRRAVALGWDELRRHTVVVLGEVLDKLGDTAEAEAMLRKVRTELEAAGDTHAESIALVNLGKLMRRQGRLDEAERLFDEALALQRRLDDSYSQAMTLTHLAVVVHDRGDLETARALYRTAAVRNQASGNRRFEAMARHHLGRLEVASSRWDDAEVELVAAEELLQALGDTSGVMLAETCLGRARVALARGQTAEAVAFLDRAEQAGPIAELGPVHGELVAALRR